MRTFPTLAVAVGLTLGFVAPAFFPALRGRSEAGTALRMGLEEAFDRSELVVEGTVVSATSGTDASGLIHTEWTLDVKRTFWGDEEEARTVRMPGGVLATGKGMVVPGMPRLAEGEDVVLLLGAPSPLGMRLPTGLSQGKYRIVTGTDGQRTAVQTGDHVSLITARTTRAAAGLEMLDYAELVARLEAKRQERLQRESAAGAAPGGR